MTESTGLPAARPRKVLTQIAPVAWEHPADRAALQTLRSVPGFDEVLKKVYGFLGERGIRLLFQADAVRVGPTQFPKLHALHTEVCTTLDWEPRPELFIARTPFANAGAYGMDRPFIVINSGAVKLLDDDEMRYLLGHELGHVMSGHALYHTLLVLLLHVSLSALPFLAGIALLPILVSKWFGIPNMGFGGTSVLIVVGVLLDTIAQVEQHRTLRKYDGFMKSGRVKFRGRQQRYM